MNFGFSKLLELLPNIYLDNKEQIGKYISTSIKWRIFDYIKEEYFYYNKISLDSDIINIEKIMHFNSDSYLSDPLEILINKEISDKVKEAFDSLSLEEKITVYNLYFTFPNLSIELILENIILGEDICPAIGKFQNEFLKLYNGSTLCCI